MLLETRHECKHQNTSSGKKSVYSHKIEKKTFIVNIHIAQDLKEKFQSNTNTSFKETKNQEQKLRLH